MEKKITTVSGITLTLTPSHGFDRFEVAELNERGRLVRHAQGGTCLEICVVNPARKAAAIQKLTGKAATKAGLKADVLIQIHEVDFKISESMLKVAKHLYLEAAPIEYTAMEETSYADGYNIPIGLILTAERGKRVTEELKRIHIQRDHEKWATKLGYENLPFAVESGAIRTLTQAQFDAFVADYESHAVATATAQQERQAAKIEALRLKAIETGQPQELSRGAHFQTLKGGDGEVMHTSSTYVHADGTIRTASGSLLLD